MVIYLTGKLHAEDAEPNTGFSVFPFEASQKLYLDGSELSKAAIQIINEKIDNSEISVHVAEKNSLQLANPFPSSEAVTLHFSKNGIPFCNMEVKATMVSKNLALMGDVPKLTDSTSVVYQTPNLVESIQNAWNALKIDYPIIDEKLLKRRECFFLEENALYPAWELTMRTDGLNYQIWANESKVFKVSRRYFDATSKIQSYARDSLTNKEMSTFNIEVKSEHLENEFFEMDPSTDESGIEKAKSADNSFIYTPSDPLFEEASLFAHANEHLSFFKQLGYKWQGKIPMLIKFHTLIGDTKNNAFYQPGDDMQSSPFIMVGDGDDQILRNLASDADVVSHEFGHHVVFQSIQDTSGESLLLHEGLADYFVFAKTGDPCLGRSICVPGGSAGACVVPDQCLRVANKTLKYGSKEYDALNAHRKSQFVSGFLYGLHEVLDPKLVPQLVYRALESMVNNSGLRHLVISTMLADYHMNNGVNACKIFDSAVSRGMLSLLSDIKCNKLESVTLISIPSEGYVAKQTPSPKKRRGFMGCSGLAKVPADQFDITLFFFLVPVVFRRRFKV